MKLFFKIIGYLVLLLIFIIIYDLTSIDFKYVNRNPITIDVNNVRNPQIKKIVRKVDLVLGELYFNFSKKKQDEFYLQDIAVNYYDDKYSSLEGADALILVTEWKEFRSPDFDKIRNLMNQSIFIDGRNQFSVADF